MSPDPPRPASDIPMSLRVLPAVLPLLLLGALLRPGEAQAPPAEHNDLLDMDVATVGVDLRSGSPLALLHSDWERVVPIWIGEAEAQAIARARQGVEMPRPMTHDLLTSVLGTLDGTLEEVWVHALRESTYYGALRIRIGGEVKEVDSRPSDALALAVRTGARIRVSEGLIEESPDVDFVSAHGERSVVRIRGTTVSRARDEDRSRFSIPSDRVGVLVLHAEEALGSRGVRRGDLVIEVSGESVEDPMQFLEAVAGHSSSSAITMRILREGEEREVEVPPRRPAGRIG